MKTIIFIDTHQGGHHLMYMRVISKILLELGYELVIFYPNPDQVVNWISAECPAYIHKFKVLPIQEPAPARLPILGRLPQPFNVLARWHHAASIAQTAATAIGKPPDLFLFNWLDSYLSAYIPHQFVDQIFPYPWTGLCFQPRLPFNSSFVSQGLNYHEILNANHCLSVGVLDQGSAVMLQKQIRNPVVTFPDFTDEANPDVNFWMIQKLRQQAGGRKIIGLLGSLNKRKGLLTLLEAALKSESENWFFAFVGQLSTYSLSSEEQKRVEAIVASAPANCFFHFELIPDEPQFNALVDACDVLFAAYEKFPYSSNILTKAAVFNKPVIASEEYCMGERVKQFRMGVTIAEGNVDQCIAALQEIFNSRAFSQECPPSSVTDSCPDFAGYRQQHSVNQLRTALQEVLVHV